MASLFEGKLTIKTPLERSKEVVVARQAALARFIATSAQRHNKSDMKELLGTFWEAYEELGDYIEKLEESSRG
jgi:hypothetical protein